MSSFTNNFNIKIDTTEYISKLCISGANNNTDKSPFAMNSVCCQHRKGFTGVYSLLFSRFMDVPINFAEIGIETGASLLMWRECFPKANLFGFEFYKNKIDNCKNLNIENIVYNEINVTNEDSINNAFKNTNVLFDIIVDDSLHENDSHNLKIANLGKYMKKGGILIIEDLDRSEPFSTFKIDDNEWSYYTFITCHHDFRNCNNDKILYLVKK
uniref:Methyltransferase domain-containing protein n=1 Tax=viral metagenome TaxID=1070528 RepID=A0A6C0BI04_9ZZZZ